LFDIFTLQAQNFS